MSVKKGQDALLLWCQRNTEGYQGVHVSNFHNSWADGLAFCALIHKHRPERLQFDQLTKENKAHNLGLAFKVAEELGIPALLDVEDITGVPKPEPLSIITYLSQYYHFFNKKRSSITLDAEQDKKQKVDENTNQNQKSTPEEPDKIPETDEEHGVCAKCGLELEGPVIETVGKAYHEHCFGCFGCGKALLGKCLNVDSNPYCESCGRKAFIESKLKKQRTLQKEPQPEPKKEEEQSSSTSTNEAETSSSSSGNKAAKWGGVALFGMAKPKEPEQPAKESQPETKKEEQQPPSQASSAPQPSVTQEAPKEQTPQQPPALPPKPRPQELSKEPTPSNEATPQASEPKNDSKPRRPTVPIPKNNIPDDDDEDAPPSKPPPRPVPSKATQEPSKEPTPSQTGEAQSTSAAQPPPLPRKPTAKPPVPSKPANAAELVASAQTTSTTQQEPKKEKPALPSKSAKPQTLKPEDEPASSTTTPPDSVNRGSAIDYKKPLPQPSKKKAEDEDSEDAPEVKIRLSYRQSKAIKLADVQAEAKKAAAETQSAFATFPNLEGFLEKKGDVGVIKSWKRRFFKLRGDKMFYYADEAQKDKDEPLGYIPLKDAKNIDPTPRMKGAFQIHTENPTRIWYLKADTDEEMQKWIRACSIHSHYDSSTVPQKTVPTSQNTLLSLKLLSQPKEGYLNKLKGGLSHKISTLSKGSLGQLWSPRFFIVKDGVLFKYETKEAFELGKPASKLPLYKCTLDEYQEEASEGAEPSENMFQITTTKGTIVLRATDEEDMHHWLNAIRKQSIMMDQIINDIEI